MTDMLKRFGWPAVIILSALTTGILAWWDSGGILRRILSFWFILICPGMALIGLLRIKDTLAKLVMAVALSLALAVLLSETMALSHFWYPTAGLGILVEISLAGAFLQILRALPLKANPDDNHH